MAQDARFAAKRLGGERELPLSGTTARAYLALPHTGSGRGVLVFHEAFGLVEWVRDVCDRLAREGFVALAPDLFAGRSSDSVEGAVALMQTLDAARVDDLIGAAARALVSEPACSGHRIAALGFCMGGALALRAACRLPHVAAAVDFYGALPSLPLDFSQARAAIFARFAERDPYISTAQVDALRAEIARAGLRADLAVERGVAHGFMNATRPEVFDAIAAARGWSSLLAFVRAELA
jgi:carboxymethylenebutenolidase